MPEPGRRVKVRTVRRWAIPVLAALVLAFALATVVRRGEEGRRLADEVRELEAEAQITSDRILGERVRVDSLTTLSRITEAAASFGLRQAGDGELVPLRAAADVVRGGEGGQ